MQPALALRPQPLRAHAPIRKGLSARHTAPIYSRPSVAAQAVYNVKFVNPTGEETTIEVADDELILSAAEAAGLELPYACHGGTCSSCCCRILEGQVDQSEQSYLDEEEQAKGFALICSSYPLSDVTLLTHQEQALQDDALTSMAVEAHSHVTNSA